MKEPGIVQPNRIVPAGLRILVASLIGMMSACGGGKEPAPPAETSGAAPRASAPVAPESPARESEAEKPATLGGLWTGDLDGMVERRLIRALVAPARTQYWIEGGQQVGAEYELLKAYEDEINRGHSTGKKHVKIHVVFVPTGRDELIPALLSGKGDIAAGVLTITEERKAKVDFGAPFFRDVSEIAVTGPQSPSLATLDDLAGEEIFVRRSSSYWGHLETLSARFEREGKKPIRLRAAPEELQDDDILEMVNAGLVGATVVDRYAALLWAQVFKDLRPCEQVVVNRGGEIAWMIRKGSPKLKASIDAFARSHGKGSTFGNTIVKKYTGSTRFAKPATSAAELAKFERTVDLFRTYGDRYGIDYLLMAAQGYQESRLDQGAQSHVGAIGVMQVMPATGKELAVGDIAELEPNIHAGVKYIRFMIDRYYANEPMTELDKGLFAFASYNAGPARIRKLRAEATRRGLDPNRWFNNVEIVAADEIGAETVTYVANIYKYYVAYKLIMENVEAAKAARAKSSGASSPPGS